MAVPQWAPPPQRLAVPRDAGLEHGDELIEIRLSVVNNYKVEIEKLKNQAKFREEQARASEGGYTVLEENNRKLTLET